MKMTKSSQTCSICINSFAKDEIIKKLPCGHILHRDCVKPWLKVDSRCPVCRFDLLAHFTKKENEERRAHLGKLF